MNSTTNYTQGKWSQEEDSQLRLAIENLGEKQWNLISLRVPGRSPVQCLHRWTKVLRPGLIKGSWAKEEDFLLSSWVQENGANNWAGCAKIITGRNGKQCRERWYNNLDPNIIKGQWTKVEDQLIFHFVKTMGPRWSMIAQALPGRTENSIKNRYYLAVKKQKKSENVKECDLAKEKLIEELELTQNALVFNKFVEECRELISLKTRHEESMNQFKAFQQVLTN